MGDYDRALMLLWDALRIRKIASEPLKISATLRLLADLHFSKEENVSCLSFSYDLNTAHKLFNIVTFLIIFRCTLHYFTRNALAI